MPHVVGQTRNATPIFSLKAPRRTLSVIPSRTLHYENNWLCTVLLARYSSIAGIWPPETMYASEFSCVCGVSFFAFQIKITNRNS